MEFNEIFTAFWFFVPAGIANMTPIISAKVPGLRNWNTPVDMGKSIGGIRILGDHKTWRGFITGIIAGILILTLQKIIFENSSGDFLKENLLLDYSEVNIIVLGTLLALGALGGDAIKSFFKRRIGIKSGKAWVPFDQIDYILGGILASLLYIQFSFTVYIWILVIWGVLHPISTIIGYLLKLKSEPI